MATINGNTGGGIIDLGVIESETQNKDSGLFQTPVPTRDADNAILRDLFGTFRTITITGSFVGTKAEQRTFIAAIEIILNGTQISSTFVSSIITSPSSRNVFVQTFNWSVMGGVETKINYTLTLLEGKAVTI